MCQILFQVSQLTFVPTLVAKPSLSVCLTIGRFCQEIHWSLIASLVWLWQKPANAKVLSRKSQLWTTTWTNYKHTRPSWLSFLSLNFNLGLGLYRTQWALLAKNIDDNEQLKKVNNKQRKINNVCFLHGLGLSQLKMKWLKWLSFEMLVHVSTMLCHSIMSC